MIAGGSLGLEMLTQAHIGKKADPHFATPTRDLPFLPDGMSWSEEQEEENGAMKYPPTPLPLHTLLCVQPLGPTLCLCKQGLQAAVGTTCQP